MAPPRLISRKQLEIIMDFLEENKEMCKGLPPGAPVSQQTTRKKWAKLGKYLNTVEGGANKTPDEWKKYWFEWRHKCRRKAADARRFQTNANGVPNRFVPLDDLEVRVLELSGKGSVRPAASTSKQPDSFLSDDSDSEPLKNLKSKTPESSDIKMSTNISSKFLDNDTRPTTPPPKWALELEERRIAAEERMAAALESMAATLRAQEERRSMLDERIADALTVVAAAAQDLSAPVLEAVQHLRRHACPLDNGHDVKNVFL